MKVSHLTLTNWFNFKKVDIDIGDRLFVFGANASGKSNFLDVFRFLRELTQDGGGLQAAVKSRGGFSAIRSLHATGKQQDVAIGITCAEDADDGRAVEWFYELVLESGGKGPPRVKKERVTRDGRVLRDRPDPQDKKDAVLRTQTHIEQVGSNQQFRVLAEHFRSVRYVHLVPQLLRDPERIGRLDEDDPFGAEFLGNIARTPKKTRNARLGRIRKALALALPQFDDLKFIQDELGRPHLEARYRHWRNKGAWQREHQFSDGTIRLIGLLWELSAPGGPLLLEEPELSLHSAVVRQLPRMFARAMTRHGRQVFLSTHSKDVFADKGVSPNEVLLLEATTNETRTVLGSELPEVAALAAARQPFGDVLVARTRPSGIEQLSMFGG